MSVALVDRVKQVDLVDQMERAEHVGRAGDEDCPQEPDGPDGPDGGWLRPVFWIWHGSYGFLVLMTVLAMAGNDAPWTVYPLLGAQALAYVVFMVRALSREGEG